MAPFVGLGMSDALLSCFIDAGEVTPALFAKCGSDDDMRAMIEGTLSNAETARQLRAMTDLAPEGAVDLGRLRSCFAERLRAAGPELVREAFRTAADFAIAGEGLVTAADVGACILVALDALPASPAALLDAVSAALAEAGLAPPDLLVPVEPEPGARLEGFSEPFQFLIASAMGDDRATSAAIMRAPGSGWEVGVRAVVEALGADDVPAVLAVLLSDEPGSTVWGAVYGCTTGDDSSAPQVQFFPESLVGEGVC